MNLENFEIKIEIYSYEIQNSTQTNSFFARKFAKNLVDTVKRSLSTHQRTNNSSLLDTSFGSQLGHSFSSSNSNLNTKAEALTYASMYRFKQCGHASLTHFDLGNSIETRNLTVTSTDNLVDHTTNTNTISQQTVTSRLPLFDQFCCMLTTTKTKIEGKTLRIWISVDGLILSRSFVIQKFFCFP